MSIDNILGERHSRYGEFEITADVAQRIKKAMRAPFPWADMPNDMKQSLEDIAGKIARIVNGDPTYIDSWLDIQGYAKLVSDRLVAGIPPYVG